MVNNVIDHADATKIYIHITREKEKIKIYILDDGEGIFKRITRLCKLENERDALLELSKGKLTTDPENHSGEGIFFTSRIFDKFEIESKGLNYTHDDSDNFDFLLDSDLAMKNIGTLVVMKIDIRSERLLSKIFDDYTTGSEEFQFNKTVIPVKLAEYKNEKLISRSQAKRLLSHLEKFKNVIFDFEGVKIIGQAFADEIFRVYATKNPQIEFIPINMEKDVKNMVNRAIYSQ